MNPVLLLARAILALVFLSAGAMKLFSRAGTRQTLLEFGVPRNLIPALTWLLPVAELGCGAALVPSRTAGWGAAGALLLLMIFLAGIVWNLSRGRRPECRCFGHLRSSPIGWGSIVRNLGLSALAVVLIFPPQRASPAHITWTWPWPAGVSVAVGIALIASALAAFALKLMADLLKQHGRLLLRMDALELGLTGERASAAPVGNPLAERPTGGPAPMAPGFTLPDLTGRLVSLEDLRAPGLPVLLLFVDPACGPCASLLPDVARWRVQHAHDLTIVLLTQGTAEQHRERDAGHELGPVLLRSGEEPADRYHAHGTPAAVLVGADGRLASPLAHGAPAIRSLVAGRVRPAKPVASERRPLAAAAIARGAFVGLLALLGTAAVPPVTPAARTAKGWEWVLEVEDATGWRVWWRADHAPDVWNEPVRPVLDATRWVPVTHGVEQGELVVSGGGLALRTRIVLARIDPERQRLILVGRGGRPSWTIDSASSRAVVALNAGQFRDSGVWGWLVRGGREVQPPLTGPLSMAVTISRQGRARFVSPESVPMLRGSGDVHEGFQSYPALLVDDGRVPRQLLEARGRVDLQHRDARLALCALRDGRLLVALTRFDNLGRVFGNLPIGLTLGEMAAVMGALGCRRAVSLDGGVSAQLLVRPPGEAGRRWTGWRSVPLGIEIVPTQ